MTLRGGAIIEPWYTTIDNLSTQLLSEQTEIMKFWVTLSNPHHKRDLPWKSRSSQIRTHHVWNKSRRSTFIHCRIFHRLCSAKASTVFADSTHSLFNVQPRDNCACEHLLEINARFTRVLRLVSATYKRWSAGRTNVQMVHGYLFLMRQQDWSNDAQNQKRLVSQEIKTQTTQKQALFAFSKS